MASYTVYILTCADGTLYTGVTTSMERRLREHNESEKGAKYTHARRPVVISHTETFPDRSSAQKRESELKHMSRAQKLLLIQESK